MTAPADFGYAHPAVDDPQVTVLIPTYRRPWFLREAIQSVLAQKGVTLDLFIGDDGNHGAAVVADFADPRVTYVAHAQRRGLAGNWNFLLNAARGRYVALLMDDDRYLPDFLATAVTALDADNSIALAFANHLFEKDGRRWPRPTLLRAGTYREFAATIIEHNPIPICASVMRRDVWEEVGPLPDTGAADLVLFGRIAELGWAFHYIDRPLMIYRIHTEAYSASQAFCHDVVTAWEGLRFSEPSAEAARRRRLAAALVGRAAWHLQLGDRAAACDDLGEARRLGQPRSLRTALVGLAARVPVAGPAGLRVKRALGSAHDAMRERAT